MTTAGTTEDDRSETEAAGRKPWRAPKFAVLADVADTNKIYHTSDVSGAGPS